ncbi:MULTISPECIES: nucleoside recognition domain-containing protein [unclassified Candidatus Frackibacter]|uniref:nucleoside recognition domain-containing protein n=1 Tax=unclassified Candidatus Frackibacter TaxID=2648818 RepID=UPI00079B3D52|nr:MULTISPECIES: nucleoside recognition domain-containing protein [unclassified Candidatus Frackibacter]KXS45976.1 MAG: nucleoside recognition domain-containing protein [Candidatus Frackibacter sp. T328-2]SDC03756.1 Nucleoside recognition [Candidatus Frackibacter sp. WG11]SEM68689.1 Nucleoside recognition [Candidatus Frackibacter sp. WG12]SFL79970.1 Nucleoside recognition [Candidatus Frackibacter sp. WG13]
MPWNQIIEEIVGGSIDAVIKLAMIIFPLMMALEVGKDLGILDKVSDFFAPLVKIFDLPSKMSLPLLVGQIFGLAYGAGVIIQTAEEENMPKDKLVIMAIFLVVCHAVVEDTLLFVAIGGNGVIMLGSRLVLATVITYLYSRIVASKNEGLLTVNS